MRMRPVTAGRRRERIGDGQRGHEGELRDVAGGDGGPEEHGQQEALAGRIPPGAAPPPAPARLMARRDHGAVGGALAGQSSEHGLGGIHHVQPVDR